MKRAVRSDRKGVDAARDLLIAFTISVVCILAICFIGAALILGEKISENMIPFIGAIALIVGNTFSVISATRKTIINPWIATAGVAAFTLIIEVLLSCVFRGGAGKVWPILLCDVVGVVVGILISSLGRMHKKKLPKFRNR